MSLAFVTGASGFIGGHLVEALVKRGNKVRCLTRKTSQVEPLTAAGVEVICGGLDRPALLDDALYGVDVVYHLAGVTCALSREDLFRVNEGCCRRIAEACARQKRPPRLIVVSSVAAAGPAPRGQIRVEADLEAPISDYGRSKLAGEAAAREWAGRVPVTIVRPGIVFGPRNRSMLPVLQSIRRLNLHLIPGYHQPALSYLYVGDLVEILLRAAARGQLVPPQADGEKLTGDARGRGIYFAVAPEYPTYADLGRIVGPLLSRPYTIVLPCLGPVPWIVAGASELWQKLRGVPDELNYDKIREATAESWACSAEAAKRDLAFAPPKSLTERFRETIEWYQREKWV
jgi:nucleoside-diphosphate-sugar epimerase